MACQNPNCDCKNTGCSCMKQSAKVSCGCSMSKVSAGSMSKASTGFEIRHPFKPGYKKGQSDLQRMTDGRVSPFRTARYLPSKDLYAEHLRYGLAKGILSPSMLTMFGLDKMAYLPMTPRFVRTAEGTYIAGTNTFGPPHTMPPYKCNSEVIFALAAALKNGLISRGTVALIGLDPDHVRS